MKILFNRNELIAAITPAMGVVSSKNTLATIEGILITASGEDSCILSAFDLEKGMRTTVSARVIEPGSYIINANKLSQIIRAMPEGDITIEVNERNVTKISGGRSSFELHALNGEDFPNMPELNIDSGFRLKQGQLRNMITQTAFAVAVNHTKPALNGSLFQIEKDRITVVSCDGNRLAVKKKRCDCETINTETISTKFILPGKSLTELTKLLSDGEEPVSIKVGRKHVIFFIDGIFFFTRVIEEEFVDYERYIPTSSKIFVEIQCDPFIRSLERASLVTEDRTMGQAKSTLVCHFEGNLLKIRSNSVTGSVYDEIPITKEGEDLEIGFSCRYLLDALRSCDTDNLRLALTSSLMSMIISPAEEDADDTFLFLALPVRM